jgi:hypothetical protein
MAVEVIKLSSHGHFRKLSYQVYGYIASIHNSDYALTTDIFDFHINSSISLSQFIYFLHKKERNTTKSDAEIPSCYTYGWKV